MNLDSTGAIMESTRVVDGQWAFYIGDQLIAQAVIPDKVTADHIENWCQAVRDRAAWSRPSDEEILARRQRGDRELGATRDDDADYDSHGGDNHPAASSGDEVRAFEEDPASFAAKQVEHFRDKHQQLTEELHKLAHSLGVWQRILKATEDNNEEP